MILGQVRDGFPRITLSLPTRTGTIRVDFIIDTGFEGELAVPPAILDRLDATLVSNRAVQMADGTRRHIPHYEIPTEWFSEPRLTEVIELTGHPLVGCVLLSGTELNVEMTEGGAVTISPL